jgi:hypothetical protein
MCGSGRPRLGLTPWRLDVLEAHVTRITSDPDRALRTCQFDRDAGRRLAVVRHGRRAMVARRGGRHRRLGGLGGPSSTAAAQPSTSPRGPGATPAKTLRRFSGSRGAQITVLASDPRQPDTDGLEPLRSCRIRALRTGQSRCPAVNRGQHRCGTEGAASPGSAAHTGVGAGQDVERVTGIEPAWPAWKAWVSKRHLCWSPPCQADVVRSACLNATHAGRKSGCSLSFGSLPVECRCSRMQLWPRRAADAAGAAGS